MKAPRPRDKILVKKSTREYQHDSRIANHEISEKLYEDAKRRQSEKYERLQNSKKRKRSVTVQANDTSKKYLMRRFNSDFSKAINSQGISTNLINYFTTCEILKDMGFISTKEGNETNEQRILFVDLWRSLKGDENEGVLERNLKVF